MVDSKYDIDRNRPDTAMKLHSYAINSAHVEVILREQLLRID